jgi:two-component system, LytTR family, response regulator
MNHPLPVKVVIVEDQLPIRKDLEILVGQVPGFIVLDSCGSVQEALVMIESMAPDILILDINLGDGTGFDILDKISNLSVKVIFLTAHAEHAIKAIKANAIDYILKPVDPGELKAALTKALNTSPLSIDDLKLAFESVKKSEEQKIVVRSYDVWEIVYLSNILYCHSEEGYTYFNLLGGKQIVSSHHLKKYEDDLPESQFIRPHQSYIVNNSYIASYRRDGYLILKDGTEIPVSLRNRDKVNRYFNNL